MSFLSGLLTVLPAVLLLNEEGIEQEKFLGLPLWIWQFLNLALFFGLLLYFVAKPLTEAFRKRQQEIAERRQEAERERAHVERLSAELRERAAKVEREIEEIRAQGRAEGEEARAALAARANEEAQRIRKDAGEEIERSLAAAKAELRRAAADLTAAAAKDILSSEINSDDRERLLSESVTRMKAAR